MLNTQLNKLINHQFIQLYTQTYQESPLISLQNIKKAHNSKTSHHNKSNLIREFEEKVNTLQSNLKNCAIDFDELIESTRNTEFNVMVTQLLFSNPKGRKLIQDLRNSTLENLKTPEKISEETFNLLYNIYKNYFFGNEKLTYEKINLPEGNKTLKTILISLKKMLVLRPKKNKKVKSASTQPYYVNIDTRNILQICQIQAHKLMEKKLVQKIKYILKEKKKWLGPRIWKQVKENQWDNYQIQLFINLIQNSYSSLSNIKSQPKQLKKQIQKILVNLRVLAANTDTPSCQTEDGIDDQMKELYSRFERMENINAILFEFKDINEIEQKMQIQRNSQQQIFEVQPCWI